MRQINEILFRAVCLCAAVLMLLASLLCSIRVAAVNDRAAGIERENAVLTEEIAMLTARFESRLSLDELERIAAEKLGMQRVSPGQIVMMDLPAE